MRICMFATGHPDVHSKKRTYYHYTIPALPVTTSNITAYQSPYSASPAAYVLLALSQGPHLHNSNGAGKPNAIATDASTLFPQP